MSRYDDFVSAMYEQFKADFECAFPNVFFMMEKYCAEQNSGSLKDDFVYRVNHKILEDFVLGAFSWSETMFGISYWNNIHERFQKYAIEKYPLLTGGG